MVTVRQSQTGDLRGHQTVQLPPRPQDSCALTLYTVRHSLGCSSSTNCKKCPARPSWLAGLMHIYVNKKVIRP